MGRKKSLKPREWALFAVPVLVLALVALFQLDLLGIPFAGRRQQRDKVMCQGNLRSLALALAFYAQENDGSLPLASFPSHGSRSFVGWADALESTTHAPSLFRCPGRTGDYPGIPTQRNYTDFFFNRRLSGYSLRKVSRPGTVLLLGDGNDGTDNTNAAYSYGSWPKGWLDNSASPAFRHDGGANYAMADGTVKWLRPGQLSQLTQAQDVFAPR